MPAVVGRNLSLPVIGGGGGGASVNKAAPFSASSPFNTLTPSNTVWFDHINLHAQVTGEAAVGNLRPWQSVQDTATPSSSSNNQRFYWGQPTDPIWTFTVGPFVATGFNRNRPLQTFTMRGPTTMWSASSSDHYFCLISEHGDDQGNAVGDYVEVIDFASVTGSPTFTVQSTNLNAYSRGNLITNWGCGSTVSGDPMGLGAANLHTNDGVRATNMAHIAGALTGTDWANCLAGGHIQHALALVLGDYTIYSHGGAPARATISGGVVSGGNYIDPATCFDSNGHNGPIYCGSKIGIPSTFTMPTALNIAIGSDPTADPVFTSYRPAVWFWNAMQMYGGYVGDYAQTQYLIFANDNNTLSDVVSPVGTGNAYGPYPLFAAFPSWYSPAYSASRTYELGQLVVYSNVLYQSLVGSNHNNTPPSSSGSWQSRVYSSGTTYGLGDAVSGPSGTLYVSLQASNTNHALPAPPATSTWWAPSQFGALSAMDLINPFLRIANYQP